MSRSRCRRRPFQAEARFTRPHDRLIAVLDTNLVELTRDVVPEGFLRYGKHDGDLVTVETLSDRIQHVALPRGKLAERQGVPRRTGFDRLLKEVVDFRDDLRPGRLIRQRHMIL